MKDQYNMHGHVRTDVCDSWIAFFASEALNGGYCPVQAYKKIRLLEKKRYNAQKNLERREMERRKTRLKRKRQDP